MNEQSKAFNLPKNIKQMGNLDEAIKIYMEDYVFTYLQQYARESIDKEQIALLVGDSYNIDGNQVLFINGAIKGEHTYQKDGMVKFSEESFKYNDEQLAKYFPDSKIVGWFYSQPGFSDYISEGYVTYHNELFDDNKVFFLNDPVENIGGFYKAESESLKSIKGFIIYYEKNEQMSEYMLDNKPKLSKDEENAFKQKDEKLIKLSRTPKPKKTEQKTAIENKKMSSIFCSLSAVLFLVCFIMGSGLIQSEDRISTLEQRIAKLDDSYRYVLSQMKDDNVHSVFAQNNEIQTIEQTTQATTKAEITTKTEQTTQEPTTQEPTTQEPTTQKIETTTISTENMEKYEIKEGDSLGGISHKFYGTITKMEDIMQVNNIDDPNKIYSGMIISLP